MESLKIEYYEVLEEEKLSNLELIFDQMEEDLESIKLEECRAKTLGMVWNSKSDTLNFKVSVKEKTIYTKREVLSTISKLYDPFGLIGPVTAKSKICFQNFRPEKINWDDSLPNILCIEWNNFVSTLKTIGTVVHLRSYGENYTPTTKLLVSKSRVTPLKKISIPRLKLCFCHLLSQLINKVVNSLKLNIDKILFSDSTIAIARTNSPPHQLKTFVANRVSNIQALTANYQWKHISSPDNPADLISRGVNPSDLEDLELWWSGSSSAMEEIIDDSCQNDLNSSEKELYLTELKKL
ncbi:integrase catalytic domain-containing protein [Trichonephila clavipes]|nr:integrase catalytic domain-containing protein [Trichonephila clavipes]